MSDIVRVVYKQDKSVAIIYPAPKSRRKLESESKWLERVFSKTIEAQYDSDENQINPLYGCDYEDMPSSFLPQNREDRESWEGEKRKGITINQNKAQNNRKEKEYKDKINKRKEEMINQQAIDDLKGKGELPVDY